MYGFVRLLYWALIIYFVYLVWKFIRGVRRKVRPSSPTKNLPQMMVKDEVCNTYLPLADALKENYQGRDYYFCSQECRQKFLDRMKSSS
jgi:uncharacterized protein